MRNKALTFDCDKCELMKVDEKARFMCKWGEGEDKMLVPHKGKKPLRCKLKR